MSARRRAAPALPLRPALLLSLGLAAAAATVLFAARPGQPFPHAQHAGLFPLCTGCHVGIPTGEEDAYYPEPESCASCHDGVREARVEWASPTGRVSNLRFEHVRHDAVVAEAGTPELDCAECHTQPDSARMNVEGPVVGRCLDCHAPPATDHFVDAGCGVCHLPLVETELPPARVAALPRPATHEADDFLAETHARLADDAPETCATCHAREQCVGCHVASPRESPVARIGAAHGRIEVPPIEPRYPVPASHLEAGWERLHGVSAAPGDCATCHTRESCMACHLTPEPALVAQLTARRDATAPGVTLEARAPGSHDSPFFRVAHGPLAAVRPQSCATCHVQSSFCAVCHEPGGGAGLGGPARSGAGGAGSAAHPVALGLLFPGLRRPGTLAPASAPPPLDADTVPPPPPVAAASPPRRGFHPSNYLVRHSAEAYGRRLDCSSCHSTQLFCRDCHESAGTMSAGRLGPGYHDAEPVWLLRHGQAARQTLETCTTCHTQRDCMQCHSQLGAFRVNPHGPGFDAARAERANAQICKACHLPR